MYGAFGRLRTYTALFLKTFKGIYGHEMEEKTHVCSS